MAAEAPRLDAALSDAFLRRLSERISYNVNIIDRDGMIIASRDPARVGSYHAAARHLVESGADEELIRPDDSLPEGTKPGVNLPIVVAGRTLGVVGVTGDPEAVEGLAHAVKTSLESMIELEALRDAGMHRRSRKSLLMAYLLYEERAPEAAVLGLAAKLGYDPARRRAPLLIRLPDGVGADEALAAVKARGVHDAQDIASATPDGSLLVFRALPARPDAAGGHDASGGRGALFAYRSAVEGYIRSFVEAAKAQGLRCYAGAPQRDFSRYRGAYRQAQWLAARLPDAPVDRPSFLFDHIEAYITALAPRSALDDALHAMASSIPPELAKTLSPTLAALDASGFNIKESAARLGLHRNSLAARLEKLKAYLGADPRADPGALSMARAIAQYLELR